MLSEDHGTPLCSQVLHLTAAKPAVQVEKMEEQELGQEEVRRVGQVALLRAAKQSWGVLSYLSWSPAEGCATLWCLVLVFPPDHSSGL